MAITPRAVGAWAASNATTQTVTLPTHQAGDMLIVRTIRKPFTNPDDTVINTTGWNPVGTGVANGATANGNGTGSMGFKAFYKLAESNAETNPVVTWGTTSAPGAAVAVSYQKAANEGWETPTGTGGGDATARTAQTSTMSSHITVRTGDLVDFFRGQCDDSGALTVPTITQTGVTYDTVTEYPATAFTSGTSNDIAADGGYRTATAGTSSAAAVITGTSAASEQHGAWMTRLRVTPIVSGQAQASIKAIGVNQHAQAQAQMRSTVSRTGQARAVISNPYVYTELIDTFTRTVQGLGTNDTGDTYFILDAPDTNLSVNGSEFTNAHMSVPVNVIAPKTEVNKNLAGERGLYFKFDFKANSNSWPNLGSSVFTLYINNTNNLYSPNTNNLKIELRITNTANPADLGFMVSYGADAAGTTTVTTTAAFSTWYTGEVHINPASVPGARGRIFERGTIPGAFVTLSPTANVDIALSGYPQFAFNDALSEGVSYDNFILKDIAWLEIGQAQARIQNTYNAFGQAQAKISTISISLLEEMAADNPLMLLRGDEDSGTVVKDWMGSHNGVKAANVNFGGTAHVATDTSMDFIGTDPNYVTVTDHADFDTGDTSFTFAVVYRRDTAAASTYTIANKTSGTDGWQLFFTSTGRIRLANGDASVVMLSASNGGAGHTDTSRHLLVVTYDGTNPKMYQDGVDITEAPTNATLVSTSTDLRIGANQAGSNRFDGQMQYIFFSDSVVSDTRVADWWAAIDVLPPRFGFGQAAAVIYDSEPYVAEEAVTINDSNTTSHTVNATTGATTNDLFIVLGSMDWNTSPTITWDADLTPLGTGTAAGVTNNGVNIGILAAYRISDGTEGGTSWTVASSGSERSIWRVFRIKGWDHTLVPEIIFDDGSTSNQPDPINLNITGWSGRDTLFIAGASMDGTGHDISAYPTGYIFGRADTYTDGILLSAQKNALANSEDPGLFVSDVSEQWAVVTIAVPGAGNQVTYNVHGQSQAWIEQTYNVHGQTQAWIENTYYELGQAQARIKNTYNAFGQTQAWIENTYFGLGQSQARIKQTYNVHGQAQARIKNTYNAFGQAQARVKNTYNGLGQAQARIKNTYNAFGQAQARILRAYVVHGQAQAQIKQSYTQVGQAQACIKNTYSAVGQAQARIKNTYNVHGQAQGQIKTSYTQTGQAQAQIKQVYYGLGQASVWIENTYYGVGQSQAQIKQTYYGTGQAQATIRGNAHGQAQGQIKQTYTQVGQSQADIKQTYNVHGQASAWIEQTYSSVGQAQASIKNVYNAHGQAQANIEATSNVHGQAQAQIKQVYVAHGQAQADIEQTYNVHAQSQAQIKQTYYGSGQAQATIRGNAHGQAQGTIKQTYNAHGQAAAIIKNTYSSVGQTQAWIEQTYNQHAQAQAQIKQTYTQVGQAQGTIEQTYTQIGQAQAYIKILDINVHGQAQAQIVQTYVVVAQAQAKINAYGVNVHGQAQGNIRFDGNTFHGQAQAKINAFDYNQYGQAQASIKQTYVVHGQAQATIEQTYSAHGQAQARILQTYTQVAQAQANILQTYVVHGQANAYIILSGRNVHGQTQALITDVYESVGQAQALILRTENALGQAQGTIEQVYNQHGQAQGQIKQTYTVVAQTQAVIRDTYESVGQAQAWIHAYDITQTGQAQANISFAGNAVHGQAAAKINAFGINVYGQSQAWIERTSDAHGQAQGSITDTYESVGQANALIVVTNVVHGQAQGTIETTYNVSGQAQAWVEQTYTATGQAAAIIRQVYSGSGQAEAYIILLRVVSGQAQVAVKAVGRVYGQAAATIEQTYNASGNAQSTIKTTVNSSGQAQALITNRYTVSGQAQALITSGTMAHAQAQAFIFRHEAYGQAQGFIKTVHTLANVTVDDDLGMSITLEDEAVFITVTVSDDAEETGALEETTITVTVSDDTVTTLTLDDEAFI